MKQHVIMRMYHPIRLILFFIILFIGQELQSQICRKDLLPPKYQNKLLAYYPFCNNTLDASGFNNHGVVSGVTAPVADRYLRPNTAWYFSGDKCESRMDAQIKGLDSLEQLSLTFWLKREGDGCEDPRLFEFWPGQDGPGQCVMFLRNGERKFGFQHRTSTNFLISREFSYTKDDWMHFAYTNDGVWAKFYINCQIVDSTPTQGKPILAKNVSFGRMNHPKFDAFNGVLDEIMIHGISFDLNGLGGLYGLCNDPSNPYNPLPDTVRICDSNGILDAGPNCEAYIWSTGETTRTIIPKATGKYKLMVSKGYGCDFFDSTYVINLKADILQKDTAICKGGSLRLTIDSLFPVLSGDRLPPISVKWSTGQVGNNIQVSPSKTQTISVMVSDGRIVCMDTIRISVLDQSSYNPFPDTTKICSGNSVVLDAGGGYPNYNWNTGARTNAITIKTPGKYKVTVPSNNVCDISDSTYLMFLPTDSCRPIFTDITMGSVLLNDKHIVQVIDADNDQDDDMILHTAWPAGNPGPPLLSGYIYLRNNGNSSFVQPAGNAGLVFLHQFTNAINADLDNDGWQDVILVGSDSITIFKNSLGAFKEITQLAGLANRVVSAKFGAGKDSVWTKRFVDANQDGYLDLVALVNKAGKSLVVAALGRYDCESGFITYDSICTLATSNIRLETFNFTDIDNDFDQDLLTFESPLPDQSPGNQYYDFPYRVYINNGGVKFLENDITGYSSGRGGNSFGVSGDFNNDGRIDIVSGASDCCTAGNPLRIWFSSPSSGLLIEDRNAMKRYGNPYYGSATPIDLDLDGWEDVLWRGMAATGGIPGARIQIHRNNGDKTFAEQSGYFGINVGSSGNCCPITVNTTSSLIDFDSDGRLDLYVESNSFGANTLSQQARWLLKNTVNKGFLNVRLQACVGVRDGTGARIRFKVGNQWFNKLVNYNSSQLESVADYITLGVGDQSSIDSLEVYWVGGAKSIIKDVAINRYLIIQENPGCAKNNPKPYLASVTINADRTSICLGDAVSFSSTIQNGGNSPTYLWKVNSNVAGNGNSFKSSGLKNGDVVTLTMYSNSACVGNPVVVSNAIIINTDVCEKKIYIPNTFTPNGDGRNDVLKVFGNYKDAKISVYNQWGQLIFSGSGASGWDGTFKGVLQPIGTYIYIADITLLDASMIKRKGSVNLIK